MFPKKANQTSAGATDDGGDESVNDVSNLTEMPRNADDDDGAGEGGAREAAGREPDDIDRVFDNLFPDLKGSDDDDEGGQGGEEGGEDDDDDEGDDDAGTRGQSVEIAEGINAEVRDGQYVLSAAAFAGLVKKLSGAPPAAAAKPETPPANQQQQQQAPTGLTDEEYAAIGTEMDRALGEGDMAAYAKAAERLHKPGAAAAPEPAVVKQLQEEVAALKSELAPMRAEQTRVVAMKAIRYTFKTLGLSDAPTDAMVDLVYENTADQLQRWLDRNPSATEDQRRVMTTQVLHKNAIKAERGLLRSVKKSSTDKADSNGARRRRRPAPSNMGSRTAAASRQTDRDGGSGSNRGSATSRGDDPNSPSTFIK